MSTDEKLRQITEALMHRFAGPSKDGYWTIREDAIPEYIQELHRQLTIAGLTIQPYNSHHDATYTS